LTGREARDAGVAAYLADDRSEVAQHLGLPRKALTVEPGLEGELRARMIMVNRPLDAKLAETRLRMMESALDERVNFLCLWIDSPGGSVEAASKMASYLARLESDKVLTAAYVPSEARGTAALVALACDDVVMHPDAVLGGGEQSLNDEEVLDLVAVIDEEVAPRKSRSPSLLAAMFQKDLVVHQYKNTRTGLEKFFTEAELADLADKDDWQRGPLVSDLGEPLRVDGAEAEQLGLASTLVDNFEEFKQEYGLLNDPALSEPTWADDLIRALASPGLAWLLLMIGLVGIYTEVQMPGIGIGGFIAAVAFTLYFWSNFLEGTAGALEIVLFLVGVSCLVLEVFVIPGFGIFGLGGGVMILVSLVLASQTFVLPSTSGEVRELRDSLLVVGGAVVGLVGSAMVMRRFLPHTPLFNRLMLAPPEGEAREQIAQREALADYRDLLGQQGTTTTQLTPSGKAQFGDELVDVITDGDLVPVNTQIEVVEVHGNRVIVQPLQ
jgi:membrane-bound ClpP family serine protease